MNKFFTIALILISANVFCQVGGMSLSNNGVQPDPSAILDLSTSNKGFLMPRITTAQRDAIASPAAGLFIYNTDCGVINYNAGSPGSPNWSTVNASNVLQAGVTISASPAGAICANTSVTFSATPSQNNLSPSYQWQINGGNVGSNSSTYTNSNLSSGDVVTCILTSSAPCVTGSPATSNAITMVVNIVPTITGTTPAGFCTGSAVTIGASANIGTINWYANAAGGSSLSSGSSFTVAGLNASTTYYVDATANGCTTVNRTAVPATFYPTSPGQPGTISGPVLVRKNDTATYWVAALPNTATYGWSVGTGTVIAGQGTDTVKIVWADTAVTSISVSASNSCGTGATQTEPIYVGIAQFYNTGTLRNGTIQNFIIPASGVTSINIDAYGAQGGSGNGGYGSSSNGCNCSLPGGKGAEIMGTVAVNGGDVFNILVGQAGGSYGGPYGNENGGGGGTFIVDQTTNTLLVAAGGGGGGPSASSYGTSCSRNSADGDGQAGNNGATPTCPQCGCSGAGGTGGSGGSTGGSYEGGGGGGYTGNGANGGNHCSTAYGGLSYTNGGTGGIGNTCYDGTGTQNGGGFGGGGGGMLSGPGAGGGYSGGGTLGNWTPYSTWGGGGGSYNGGTNQTNTSGVQSGHGKVIISW